MVTLYLLKIGGSCSSASRKDNLCKILPYTCSLSIEIRSEESPLKCLSVAVINIFFFIDISLSCNKSANFFVFSPVVLCASSKIPRSNSNDKSFDADTSTSPL